MLFCKKPHYVVWATIFLLFTAAARPDDSRGARQITWGPHHHFYGYIGHVQNIPWSGDGRYLVALRTTFQDRMPAPTDGAEIVLLDTQNDYAVRVLDTTRAWNFQQGTMLYWNPAAPDKELFFNDRDPNTNEVFTVRFDIEKAKRVHEYRFSDTPFANSGVAQTGGYFLGLNYGRLARLRPVTGYPEAFDWTTGTLHPENDGIFKVDIETGHARLLVSYRQLADALRPLRPDVESKALFINHTLSSRTGERIYFYARGDFETTERLDVPFTIECDGSGLTAHKTHIGGHPEWAEGHLLVGKHGADQVLYDTDSQSIHAVLGDGSVFPNSGGDVALSPNGEWLVNGYRTGKANSYVFLNRNTREVLRAGPFPVDQWTSGELRIDGAPCWNRESTAVVFPAIANDTDRTRQMFLLELGDLRPAP